MAPAGGGTSYVWTGGAGTGNWATAGNWSSGVAPTAATSADSLTFPSGPTIVATTNNIGVVHVGSITISGSGYTLAAQTAADSVVLGGTTSLSPGGGTLTVSSTNETISQAINLGGYSGLSATDYINVSSGGSVTISGALSSLSGTELLVDNSGYSGTLKLTTDNSGGAVPANGLQGPIILFGGVLDITNSNALGYRRQHQYGHRGVGRPTPRLWRWTIPATP